MRKQIVIIGSLIIVTMIIICGSAMGAWVTVNSWYQCTNITNIENAPDGSFASIGVETPPVLGWVLLDLDSGNEMGPSDDFDVIAYSSVQENYSVYVGETTDIEALKWVGDGSDDQNETFTTPSQPFNAQWRYIFIEATTGITALTGGDHAYGPDIDAVGW